MKHRNRYFLVARYLDTNQFELISFDENDFSLERLDLYTTQFSSSLDFSKNLLRKGKISSLNVDFYIVTPKKINGKQIIQTQEVLYSDCSKISSLAQSSLNNNLSSNPLVSQVVNNFCYQMSHSSKLYEMVVFGKTDLYSKFVHYFYEKRFQDDYSILYRDGGWVKKSYPLLRNIVLTINNMSRNSSSLDASLKEKRMVLNEALLKVTDKEYDENQFTLFDFFPETMKDDSDKLLIKKRI